MDQFMMVIFNSVKSKEQVVFIGKTILNIKENFLIIILKEKEDINGQIVEFIMEIGKITKCMEQVNLHGVTEENTQANIKMIKSTGKGFFIGQTDKDIKVIGKMVSNKEKEYLLMNKEKKSKDNGRQEKE